MSAHPQDVKTDAGGTNGTDGTHVHDARQRSANEHPGTDAVSRFLLLGGTHEVLGDPDGSRIGNDCSVFKGFSLLFWAFGFRSHQNLFK